MPSDPPPTVGDWVAAGEQGIEAVLERRSVLSRQDPDGRSQQVLAANFDLVLVVAPCDRLSLARVERELLVAWESGARPVVVLTKADLVEDPEALRASTQDRLVGVEVLRTSVPSGEGTAALQSALRPQRSAVLLGPSGSGKSSLANALIGHDELATGDVRDGDRRGRHTTTRRQLILVPGGGVLIDTPGLRALAPWGGEEGLEAAFPEITELAQRCRFRDCWHHQEPGCAVLKALASGDLDPARLQSYRKLEGEVADQDQEAPVTKTPRRKRSR